MAGIFSTKIF